MCSSILIFCTFCWISTITSDRQVKLSFVFFVVLVDQCVCWNLENTLSGTRVGLGLGITEPLVMWVFPFPPLDLSGVLLQSVTLIFNYVSWNAHTHTLTFSLLFFFLILLHTQSKIVCLFVYLPLFCLSCAVYCLRVFGCRCRSWRPSMSVCFIAILHSRAFCHFSFSIPLVSSVFC